MSTKPGTDMLRAMEDYVHTRSAEDEAADQIALFLPILASTEVTMANWPIFTDEYAVAQITQEAVLDAMDTRYGGPTSAMMQAVRVFLARAAKLPATIPVIDLDAMSADEGGHA